MLRGDYWRIGMNVGKDKAGAYVLPKMGSKWADIFCSLKSAPWTTVKHILMQNIVFCDCIVPSWISRKWGLLCGDNRTAGVFNLQEILICN